MMRLTILGAPRTKKNSSRVLTFGTRRKIVPSEPYLRWRDAAVMQIPRALRLPDQPYNCRLLIYRERRTGDAVGYYQAVADMLEEAGVLSDDKWIVAWDGSRLLHDKHRPRVEIEITPLASAAAD